MNPEPHYTIRIENHRTAEWVSVELMDLPFQNRKYEVRVNGRKPSSLQYAT
jgi:beta-N-acetylglucosaminidase